MVAKSDIQRYINSEIEVSFKHDASYSRRQRTIDLAIGLAALAATSPILGAAILAIWIEDRGTPFFTQQRVGLYGRLFTIYKLRTMRLADCSDALSPKSKSDARITRVGAILRKTSIDELPQLLNVVRGDMALVGPRPEMPFVVGAYARWQHCRHLRKPGITGLWQITVRKSIPMQHPDATKIDLEYVRTASTKTDSQIFMRTFTALFRAQGAY